MGEEPLALFFEVPSAIARPEARELIAGKAGAYACDGVVTADIVASDGPEAAAGGEWKGAAAWLASDEKRRQPRRALKQDAERVGRKVMQEQIRADNVGARRRGALQEREHVCFRRLDRPSERGKLARGRGMQEILLIDQDHADISPARGEALGDAQHKGAIARTQLDDRGGLTREGIAQQSLRHDAGLQHPRVDAAQVASRPQGARVIRRERVEPFRFDDARRAHSRAQLAASSCVWPSSASDAVAASCCQGFPSARNNIVSATRPGPNAMAQPVAAFVVERRKDSSTN